MSIFYCLFGCFLEIGGGGGGWGAANAPVPATLLLQVTLLRIPTSKQD